MWVKLVRLDPLIRISRSIGTSKPIVVNRGHKIHSLEGSLHYRVVTVTGATHLGQSFHGLGQRHVSLLEAMKSIERLVRRLLVRETPTKCSVLRVVQVGIHTSPLIRWSWYRSISSRRVWIDLLRYLRFNLVTNLRLPLVIISLFLLFQFFFLFVFLFLLLMNISQHHLIRVSVVWF